MAIRKRTLPSGKTAWLAEYRDGEGKRRFKQFVRKMDAENFLLTARVEVRQGVHVAESQSITIKKAADLWIERAENENLEASTLASYKQHRDLHIVPSIGATKLSTMTVPSVQAFADELIKTKSRAMTKKILGSLSSIFTEAQRKGLANHNPVAAVKVKIAKRHKKRPEMPTTDELRAILAATSDDRRPLIYTAAFTGLRASELRGLQWPDLDLDAGALHVVRRADPYNKLGSPKSEAGTRTIPLGPTLKNMLQKWQEQAPASDLGLVFPNGAGNVESHANLLQRVFWPIQIKAGVSVATGKKDDDGKPIMKAKYSLHALRHAAAASWIASGMTPKRIQVLMGHSSIQMTFDTYGYLFEAREDDLAAAEAIENKLIPT
ncbi:tyrosine-type recombinase/integrase [Brucella anthropi]|uniref:Tyrosine-type recombinase/integrase n=1 Tax=Brucella anthropi TaxID=529 RepID=A0A6L3YZL2_BRUAN|nr:tyrosine-type recombinase/integrase [Brucella anthropi]KAB2761990.1 tyrosine-type recombinase/integrase [Brucella anthropi]UVV66706.1 tyrosine-type recombinase/integrase [Brucella anthropi]